jgi:hypothetical protein
MRDNRERSIMPRRVWILVLALLASSLGLAQTRLTVDQLVSFVRSSIELKHSDKQTADFLKKVVLTQRLEPGVAEDLLASGAGQRTFEALNQLVAATKDLELVPRPGAKPKTGPAPPSEREKQRVLQQVREYAQNYTRNLPDFLCLQVTRRWFDPSGLEFWQKHDEITARLSYVENREDYKVVLVNNTPTSVSIDQLGGATSTGEFGSMMKEIFEEESATQFMWSRWGTLRGRRAHVFSYRVPKARSKWSISWNREITYTPGYSGFIYADRDTGMILRITLDAQDIPPSFPVQQATTMLDYDFATIGEAEYLLPMRAQVRMREGKLLVKNEVEFRRYRKFSAEAVITFDTSTPEPLPDSDEKTP